MTVSDIIAIVSTFISVFAVFLAYYSYRGSVRAASRPVLIFSMVSTFQWQVQNVGNGPAINVVVADCHPNHRPDSVTNCYPIAAGGHLDLKWMRAGWELIAIYTDVFGNTFTTVCAGGNKLFKGNKFSIKADTDQWVHQLLESMPERSSLRTGDLHGKSREELDIMRNEIYARHGYIFRRQDLQEYFDKQDWYEGVTRDIAEVAKKLSPREKYEVQLILDFQRYTGKLKDETLRGPGSLVATKRGES